jgi:hypothetical protein
MLNAMPGSPLNDSYTLEQYVDLEDCEQGCQPRYDFVQLEPNKNQPDLNAVVEKH